MFKSVSLLLGCSMFALTCMAAPTTLDCQSSSKLEANLDELETVAEIAKECPAPTKSQFGNACLSMYEREKPKNSEQLSYKYQEELWQMSCATPGKDSLEVARTKIQTMWSKYRESFRCYNYPTFTSTDKNILKFSMDTGFSGFIVEAVKKYKLDMNFKDPSDGKTIMDFLAEKKEFILNSPPVDQSKAQEYERIYKLLSSNGAKHAKDL